MQPTTLHLCCLDNVVGDDGGDKGATERLVKHGVLDFELADLAVERLILDAVEAGVDGVFFMTMERSHVLFGL